MPICEADPWREQYFEHAACPPEVKIPTEDSDAWHWYPRYRHVYDKIDIALNQGLNAAPHGVQPPSFPVFSKPIVNLKGMGVGSRILRTSAEYEENLTAGHMWMTLLNGRHVSTDVALVAGEPHWWRHVAGIPSRDGAFDYWTVHAANDPTIEDYCGNWIRQNLEGFTGIINLETIGGRIIEVHLRMSDQWPDLYGVGWIDSVIRLYVENIWNFADAERRDGFSIVLFGPHGPRYRHPPSALVDQVRKMSGVSSAQITFHEDRRPEQHAMPPGGFRLAIVNAWNLQAGLAGREMLRKQFLAQLPEIDDQSSAIDDKQSEIGDQSSEIIEQVSDEPAVVTSDLRRLIPDVWP